MPHTPFERSVFVNCPFDEDYDSILQAMLFCILYMGFSPRLARERNDSGEVRLEKIRGLIEESKYSIHDLSRCQARRKGEHFRLNMPFELGVDYACRQYFGSGRDEKRFLVLEEKPYRYQAALSDIAGCDIQYHGGDFQKAVGKCGTGWSAMPAWLRKGQLAYWPDMRTSRAGISRSNSPADSPRTISKIIRPTNCSARCRNGWRRVVPSLGAIKQVR